MTNYYFFFFLWCALSSKNRLIAYFVFLSLSDGGLQCSRILQKQCSVILQMCCYVLGFCQKSICNLKPFVLFISFLSGVNFFLFLKSDHFSYFRITKGWVTLDKILLQILGKARNTPPTTTTEQDEEWFYLMDLCMITQYLTHILRKAKICCQQ